MANTFNIDDHEFIKLTNKLDKLNRSALPVAVRSTLNDVAFKARKGEIPISFKKEFEVKKSGFINSHLRVNKCKNTFEIDEMVSEAGVIKGKSVAGDNLKAQEFGESIKKKNIALAGARTGNNLKTLVSKKYYIRNIRAKENVPKWKNQEFIRTAFRAGKGEKIMYNNLLSEIKTIKKLNRNKLIIKLAPLYLVKPGMMINLSEHPFIQRAGRESMKFIPKIYAEQAKRQIEKYNK